MMQHNGHFYFVLREVLYFEVKWTAQFFCLLINSQQFGIDDTINISHKCSSVIQTG